MRGLTAGERRYVRRCLGAERRIALIVLLVLSAGLIAGTALFAWAYRRFDGSVAAPVALELILLGCVTPVFLFFLRRVRPVAVRDEVRTVTGEFRSENRPVADTWMAVRFVGDQVVVVPEHWLSHLRDGELVTAEICDVPHRPYETAFYGAKSRGVALTIGDRLSVDREIPLGLLAISPLPRLGAILAMSGLVLFSSLSLWLGDDIARLGRETVSGPLPRQYASVAAFASDRPRPKTLVEIARASVVVRSGRGAGEYLVDLEHDEVASLERVTAKFEERIDALAALSRVTEQDLGVRSTWERFAGLAGEPDFVQTKEEVLGLAHGRQPLQEPPRFTTAIASALDLFGRREMNRLLAALEPIADSAMARHKDRPVRAEVLAVFAPAGARRLDELADGMRELLRVGSPQRRRGIYQGQQKFWEQQVSVIDLRHVKPASLLLGVVPLGAACSTLGLVASIIAAFRDRRVRRRLVRNLGKDGRTGG